MKKRTKIVVLAAMIMLLGVTGYLNLTLNNRVVDASAAGQVVNYFAEYAQTRETTRQKEFLFYEAILANETSSATARQEAEEGRLALVANMESELAIEGLIRGIGFNECLVTYSNSYVNVLVKGQLERPEVAQIVSIVKQQTGVGSDFITITPV